jgi:hypothetical protein
MSEQMRRAFEAVVKSAEENAPRVACKLSKAGIEIDQAVIYSAAKYFVALDKLSKE